MERERGQLRVLENNQVDRDPGEQEMASADLSQRTTPHSPVLGTILSL